MNKKLSYHKQVVTGQGNGSYVVSSRSHTSSALLTARALPVIEQPARDTRWSRLVWCGVLEFNLPPRIDR